MTKRDNEVIAAMAAMLDKHGDRFSGGSDAAAKKLAQNWLDHGFDVKTADSWCAIGVWDAGIAQQFRDAGLSPENVAAAADRLRQAENAEWDAIDDASLADDFNWKPPCSRESRYTDGDPVYSICNHDTEITVLIDAIAKGALNNG